MTMTIDNPFFPLSFIAGPAILMNASAIMQNGTNIRYSLAVTQWREFNALLTARDNSIASLYTDPVATLRLAERRIHLLLRGLNLLNVAIGLFGMTTFLGLFGSFLARAENGLAAPATFMMIGFGGLGVLFLLAATGAFLCESANAKKMIKLHLRASELFPL